MESLDGSRRGTRFTALAVLALTAGAPASAAAAALVATERVAPAGLELTPQIPFSDARLRIVGPAGFDLETRFEPGEPIAGDLADGRILRPLEEVRPLRQGEPVDGYYLWELTLQTPEGERAASGSFFVEDGIALSREAKRLALAAVRETLERQASEAGPATEADIADIVKILDDNNNGSSRLSLYADNPSGVTIGVWDVTNTDGAFAITEAFAGTAMAIPWNSNQRVGIGTFAPSSYSALHVSGPLTGLIAHTEEDTGQSFFSGVYGGRFIINPFGAGHGLLVDTAGRVTVGPRTDPESTLTVRRADGTTRLLVSEDSMTTAPRELFRLRNKGVPQFRFEDTASGVTWAFAQQVGGFVANRLGTGGNELFLQGNGRLIVGPGGFEALNLAPTGNLTIAGTLTQGSSREVKTDFAALDPQEVLAKVLELPVTSWRYRKDGEGGRHVGPVAEDFHSAFGLGADDEHLAPGDAAGIALAAIQALNDKLVAENEELRARIERLERLQRDP